MATRVENNGGLYFVPALSGLGAPHWDMSARGSFFGITAGITSEHMVRAVLEAIAYQVKEVIEIIDTVSISPIKILTVDGGACENNFLMQFQADLLEITVERPMMCDTTVQGIAFAAGITIGFWDNIETLRAQRIIERLFEPSKDRNDVQAGFRTWLRAVECSKHWLTPTP